MGVEVFGNKIINISKSILFKLAQPELKKIQLFKDIHRGESCYVVGDGVSLKWFDLKNFSNKVSIGSGSLIPFHEEFKLLNMRYLMLLEPFWFFPAFWTDNFTKSTSMPCISKAYCEIIKKIKTNNFS
jgi:hypothetical protein